MVEEQGDRHIYIGSDIHVLNKENIVRYKLIQISDTKINVITFSNLFHYNIYICYY